MKGSEASLLFIWIDNHFVEGIYKTPYGRSFYHKAQYTAYLSKEAKRCGSEAIISIPICCICEDDVSMFILRYGAKEVFTRL